MKSKDISFLYELKLLFRWADTAIDNDEFWRRIIIGSVAYPQKQLAINNLVALCTAQPNKPFTPELESNAIVEGAEPDK